jgi:SPX domain protein involved in polyphosphate accumulation
MRLEYKYLIPVSKFQKIRDAIIPYFVPDKFALKNKSKEYTVRSLYFDTPRLQYYFEKVEGAKNRKKVRIRVYDNYAAGTIAFLEIKRKNGEHISKFRAPLLYQDLDKLFEIRDVKNLIICNKSHKAIENAKMFLSYLIQDNLNPVSLVTYEREALVSKFDHSLRITFDKNLRFLSSAQYKNMFEEEKLQKVLKDKVIIEIKFKNTMPTWLRDILIKYGLHRKSVSKYVICMDGNNHFDKTKKLALTNLNLSHSSLQNIILKKNAS